MSEELAGAEDQTHTVDHLGCGHPDEQYEVENRTLTPDPYRMWHCRRCGVIGPWPPVQECSNDDGKGSK